MINWIFDLDDTLYSGPFESYEKLRPNMEAAFILQKLSGKIHIFSNALLIHCHNVLLRLGLYTLFHPRIYSRDIFKSIKPNLKSYLEVRKYLNSNPKDVNIFFDDRLENLEMAKKIGWKTVHIHKIEIKPKPKYVDSWFPDINTALHSFSQRKIEVFNPTYNRRYI